MEDNSIHVIYSLSKKSNWVCRLKMFTSQKIIKGYIKLLVREGSTVGVDNLLMQNEYKDAVESKTDLNKRLSS